MTKYLDNPELLARVFGIDIDIEMSRLAEIEERKKQTHTNRKCYVCKEKFESYFSTTRKCAECEYNNRTNV